MQDNETPDRSRVDFTLDDLRSIDALAREHPTILSVPTLRWQLRHRDENGLADAVVKVGKKLLIVKPRYTAWLTSGSGALK